MMGMPGMNMGMGMMPMMGMPGMNMGMGMMPTMNCQVSCEMMPDGMMMKMKPANASMMDMMRERCDMMNNMMNMGMPMMIMCGGMPMMMGMSTTATTTTAPTTK
jgi:hypothetical protein